MTALPTTCTWHAQDLRFQTLSPPQKKTTIYLDKTTNENVKDWKTSSSSDAWSFCQLCLEFLRWGPKNCKDSAVELIDDHWWYDLGPNLHVVHQLQKKFPGEQAVRMRRKLHQWDGLMSWKWSLWSRSGLSMFLYFPIWHSTDVKTVSSLGMTTKERHISYHNIVSYCRYHIILYIRHDFLTSKHRHLRLWTLWHWFQSPHLNPLRDNYPIKTHGGFLMAGGSQKNHPSHGWPWWLGDPPWLKKPPK